MRVEVEALREIAAEQRRHVRCAGGGARVVVIGATEAQRAATEQDAAGVLGGAAECAVRAQQQLATEQPCAAGVGVGAGQVKRAGIGLRQ